MKINSHDTEQLRSILILLLYHFNCLQMPECMTQLYTRNAIINSTTERMKTIKISTKLKWRIECCLRCCTIVKCVNKSPNECRNQHFQLAGTCVCALCHCAMRNGQNVNIRYLGHHFLAKIQVECCRRKCFVSSTTMQPSPHSLAKI